MRELTSGFSMAMRYWLILSILLVPIMFPSSMSVSFSASAVLFMPALNSLVAMSLPWALKLTLARRITLLSRTLLSRKLRRRLLPRLLKAGGRVGGVSMDVVDGSCEVLEKLSDNWVFEGRIGLSLTVFAVLGVGWRYIEMRFFIQYWNKVNWFMRYSTGAAQKLITSALKATLLRIYGEAVSLLNSRE